MSPATCPDLNGKVVLVTGSSKALGAETARRFAALGAKIAMNVARSGRSRNVAASIRADGGECIGVRADVTSGAEMLARLQPLATLEDERRPLAL